MFQRRPEVDFSQWWLKTIRVFLMHTSVFAKCLGLGLWINFITWNFSSESELGTAREQPQGRPHNEKILRN